MASQHIEIQATASRLSADVRLAVDTLRDLQSRIIKVTDILNQVAIGGDWPAVAVKLGTSEVDAQAAYNLLVGVADDLQTSDVNAVIDRLG